MVQNRGGSTSIGAVRHCPTPQAERLADIATQDERLRTRRRCDGSRRGHGMRRRGRSTGVFVEDLVDGRAPTRRGVFTEHVLEIAHQQVRYAVGHDLSPLGIEGGLQ
jgi:hypothetical protein